MTKETGLIIGSLYFILGIAIGAFGAHGLKEILIANSKVDTFQTGVEYLFYNSIGILIISIVSKENKYFKYSIVLLSLGIIFFSFSLFILSVTNISKFGIITPFGGLFFIIGWVSFILNIKNKS